MTRTVVTRSIGASPGRVFQAVADIAQFSRAVPEIIRYEFLSPTSSGVGTRFREVRSFRGREVTTELVITEWVPDSRVRMVAESHGTVWDTVYGISPRDGGSLLELTMEARSTRLFTRLMVRLTSRLVRTAIERNLDQVKAYCERG